MRAVTSVVRIVQPRIVQACGLFQFDGNFVWEFLDRCCRLLAVVVCSGPLFLMTILNVHSEYIVIFLFLLLNRCFFFS